MSCIPDNCEPHMDLQSVTATGISSTSEMWLVLGETPMHERYKMKDMKNSILFVIGLSLMLTLVTLTAIPIATASSENIEDCAGYQYPGALPPYSNTTVPIPFSYVPLGANAAWPTGVSNWPGVDITSYSYDPIHNGLIVVVENNVWHDMFTTIYYCFTYNP